MKVRNGFVSNSSTSSFICEICGAVEAERDVNCRDVGMLECKNKHVICEDHVTEEVFDEIEEFFLKEEDDSYFPIIYCPICNMKIPSEKDITSYLKIKSGKSDEELFVEIKKHFANYNEFTNYLKGKTDED